MMSECGLGRPGIAAFAWVVLATVLSFAYHQTVILDQDVSYNYLAGMWMLDGQRLYVDMVEINPPLIFYLSMPGAWLARAFGLAAATGLQLWLHLVGLVSLLLCLPLLHRRRVLVVALPLIIFALPGQAWGQREHLLVIFLLPWLLLRARADGRVAGSAVYPLFAAVGMLLKPFFVVFPLAVLLGLAWSRRSLRPFGRDTRIFLAMGLAYLAATMVLHPEYISTVAPLAALVYDVWNHDFGLMTLVRGHVLLAAAVGLMALRLAGGPWGRAAAHRWRLLLLAVAAGFASYYVQRKGWEYHALPAVAFTAVFLLAVAGAVRGLPRWLAAMAALIATLFRFDPAPSIAAYMAQPLPAFVAGHPGLRLAALTSDSLHTFPLVLYADVVWSLRFQLLWPVSGLYAAQAAGHYGPRHHELFELTAQGVAEDLLHRRPDAVAVDSLILHDLPFDYIAFLSANPAFRDAWSAYEPCRVMGALTLYTRKDVAVCR